MIKLVGQEVYDRAHDHYQSSAFKKSNPSEEEKLNDELVDKLRMPIAYKATQRYYQLNIVSHEDTGRKYKINRDNETMPWEWMLDRDDTAQNRTANETTDLLLEWMDRKEIQEWMDSPSRQAARSLFVSSPQIFQDHYPATEGSFRFYYTVLPFISEIQTVRMAKVLGSVYAPLLEYWKGKTANDQQDLYDSLIALVQKVTVLEVMILAAKRLSLQGMPYGVVQQFKSMFQGRDSASVPLEEVIRRYTVQLAGDSSYIMTDLKQLLQESDPKVREYQLLPANDPQNKFFRT